jgi:uncharacterized RDD family membrane protein YckC
MYCSGCGKENENNKQFCVYCGNKLSSDQLLGKKQDEPGTIIPQPSGHNQIGEAVPQIRPWVRFFARFIDIGWSYCLTLVFFAVLGIFIYLILPKNDFLSNISPVTDIIITTLTTFLLLALIEPFFISNYGQTPGKWLLKTKVMNSDGSLLTFSQALNRSLSVYSRGFLLGIPFLNWITLLIESTKLEKEGKTTWDRKGEFIVQHEKIGILRVIVAIIFVVLIRAFMMYMMPAD